MALNKMSSFISIALIIYVCFCTAARNKPALLMAGVLETALLLLSSETMAVVFKLLGVLRMLVDGQGEKRWAQRVQFSWIKTLWCVESVLVQFPRLTEREEVQVIWGRGRGACGYLVLYYQSLALTLLKIGVSDSWLL